MGSDYGTAPIIPDIDNEIRLSVVVIADAQLVIEVGFRFAKL